VFHRPVAGAEADQPGHAHVIGIVVLDGLLAAERVQHRRLRCPGEVDELLVGVGAPGPSQDRHPAGGVQDLGCGRE
jgi:hypothetical protein